MKEKLHVNKDLNKRSAKKDPKKGDIISTPTSHLIILDVNKKNNYVKYSTDGYPEELVIDFDYWETWCSSLEIEEQENRISGKGLIYSFDWEDSKREIEKEDNIRVLK